MDLEKCVWNQPGPTMNLEKDVWNQASPTMDLEKRGVQTARSYNGSGKETWNQPGPAMDLLGKLLFWLNPPPALLSHFGCIFSAAWGHGYLQEKTQPWAGLLMPELGQIGPAVSLSLGNFWVLEGVGA